MYSYQIRASVYDTVADGELISSDKSQSGSQTGAWLGQDRLTQ